MTRHEFPPEEMVGRKLTAYLNQRGYMGLENLTIALGLKVSAENAKKIHAMARHYAPYMHNCTSTKHPLYCLRPRHPGHEPNPFFNQPEEPKPEEPTKESDAMGLYRTTEDIEAAIARTIELLPTASNPTVEWFRKTSGLPSSVLYSVDDRIGRVKAAIKAEKERRDAEWEEAQASEALTPALSQGEREPELENPPMSFPELESEALTPSPSPEGRGEPEPDLAGDQAEDYERQIAELNEQLKAVVRRNEELDYKLQAQAAPAPALPTVAQGDLVERLHTLDVEVAAIRGEMQRLELELEKKLDDAAALRRALDLLGLGLEVAA